VSQRKVVPNKKTQIATAVRDVFPFLHLCHCSGEGMARFLVAAPWAFGNIATGPFEEDDFRAGWQVLAALPPGVAEEAWARVFMITLLYWIFRRYGRARTSVLAAAILGTYWFAYLHAPANPLTVGLLGTAQVLPMTFLWLRRSLEAAIGFHVCVDLVRFFTAYLAIEGIWFVSS
jgi:hypothetical protein